MKEKQKRFMINVGTTSAKTRDKVRKRLKLLAALVDKNQDEVLLRALDTYLKKVREENGLNPED